MSENVPAPRPTAFVDDTSAPDRLTQLLALYDAYKDAADQADKQLKTITDAIKAELTGSIHTADDTPYETYKVVSSHLRQPLALTWRTERRVNVKALKAEQPAIYRLYTRDSGRWDLRRNGK